MSPDGILPGPAARYRYLTSKDQYLRYDRALAAGWPVATGVIEGACRHLIGGRVDITGPSKLTGTPSLPNYFE